ncbi:Ran binding domain [Dillenia turbinata]|uniref:Ran binding domain n=1 Tax=Dillenia turbinata TaxID=194707 RepID=A0AAN8VHS9_9MAGN
MKGTKRLAEFKSNLEPNDSIAYFINYVFGFLNSWVQSQLQNHPDELWEDVAQHYLFHASNIMKLALDTKTNEIKLFQSDSGFASTVVAPSFPSWSSTPPSGAQNPFIFGNQTSVPQNHDASDVVNGEDEEERPCSPSVKKAEEEGIIVVHEVKCKLYVKSINPEDKDAWKDKGTGQLSIKCKEGVAKGTKESKPTIVVRNDVGRLLLNALLYTGIKTSLQNSIAAIFHTLDDMVGGNNDSSVMARTFLIRTKTEEHRNRLAAAIKEYAPAD